MSARTISVSMIALMAAMSAMPAGAQEAPEAAPEAPEVEESTGTHEFGGHVGFETRVFFSSPTFSPQANGRVQPSLMLQPEYRYEWNDGLDRITVIPYGRIDSVDRQRTHFDIRELNWQRLGDDWDMRIGLAKVFWGVTESRHLVDIINQSDTVENPNGEDKLGQPMLNVNFLRDWGNVGLFVMPGFRERTYPGWSGRLRDQMPTDIDNPTYESSMRSRHVDFAARYSHFIGDWDFGLSYFHGTGREPRLPISLQNGRLIRTPTYDIIDQAGIDIQSTQDAWLLKFEAISRWGNGDPQFFAAVPGVEYTIYDLAESGADLGLLAEYLYDDRNANAPVTSADSDVFMALRLTMNDSDDTDFLIGSTVDRHTGALAIGVEASTRLSEEWTAELEGSIIANMPFDDPLTGLRQDDYLQLRLLRYF
ncbi:hypothetical protein [Magnetospira sp. QH-2]|uniref:hypothetical protein n=1 Tax=Magnetospira sp. (strain QH-2) TaxID=1288970 RepID=UPI0003E8158B|nr:hypothetical protein [Magnetospira sp. QH-2]CCQ72910.1 conserved exported protein of unknown function [Magnetospira sp. QH-2]